MANADKAAGKIRQYKVIFTPQKVVSTESSLIFYHYIFLMSLFLFHSSMHVRRCWRSRGCSEVMKNYHCQILFCSSSFNYVLLWTISWLKQGISCRCDHWWMGVLPSTTGWWHHQSGAAWILPRQLPGKYPQSLRKTKFYKINVFKFENWMYFLVFIVLNWICLSFGLLVKLNNLNIWSWAPGNYPTSIYSVTL